MRSVCLLCARPGVGTGREVAFKKRAGEMAPQVKALAAKSDGPSSVPRAHMMKGENQTL